MWKWIHSDDYSLHKSPYNDRPKSISHGNHLDLNHSSLPYIQAINYVAQYNQTTASRYPYSSGNGATGSCNSILIANTPSGQAVKLQGSASVVSPSNSESALMAAVAVAPTTIYFDVENSFQLYSGGVSNNEVLNQGMICEYMCHEQGITLVEDSSAHCSTLSHCSTLTFCSTLIIRCILEETAVQPSTMQW